MRNAMCWLAARYIAFVYATSRWTEVGREHPEAIWSAGKPFILSFWHGRLLMMSQAWPRPKPIHMLISQHRDGQLIARTVAHFGIKSAAGSSSRGGAGGLRIMLKALKDGECVGITPDGPRGPRQRAADGVIHIARMSGVPVVPLAYATRSRRLLDSWDRFLVPRPFTRGAFVWGEPLVVPRDADPAEIERLRALLEDRMNAITAQADGLVGRPTTEPAAPC
ncbi:lysophospholipid acyltransferase family protein [Caenispirillum bisanense]|nr:lysophospholipid acyltransferase family protein [Caenispirillum bisanense]